MRLLGIENILNIKKILNNQSNQKLNLNIEFLDGLRGSFALWVILHHCTDYFDLKGDYKIFVMLGLFIGVFGFFLLSAFLLTYRLFYELNQTDDIGWSEILLIVKKYFVRRFFRIYIPFVIFTSMIHFVSRKIGGWAGHSSWFSMVTLQSSGETYLWTIAPEIKYYFFIPVFTVFIFKTGKFWFVFMIIFNVLTVYVDYYNVFGITLLDMSLINGYKFLNKFTLFFNGSLMAIYFYKLEKWFIYKYFKTSIVSKIAGAFLIGLYCK